MQDASHFGAPRVSVMDSSEIAGFAGTGGIAEFDAVYDQYADAIFRHLYYRLQERERALELTQEVFTRYYEYVSAGRLVENPKAFLYRSAHNAFVNDIRKPTRTTSLETLMESGFDVRYSEPDREELEAQREAVSKLRELDPPSREVLTLRYVDGFKVKEIAEMLRERENTVSARIRRALKKLKLSYEHED